MFRHPLARLGLVTVGLLLPASALSAQTDGPGGAAVAPLSQPDTIVVTAQITQMAGTTIYIDVGEDAGLVEGDTVTLLSSDLGNALLRVVSSSATRSVLTFLGAPVPLTRGNRIRLSTDPQITAEPTVTAGPPYRTEPEGARVGTGDSPGPSIAGRISLNLNALQSTTMWDGVGSGQSRTFMTPVSRINATATNLPGGVRVDLRARGSHRHTSGSQLASTTSLRLYAVSITKVFDRAVPVHLQAGRFHNPYESFSGYWDGGMLRLGGEGAGAGIALGYRPDHANEGFSTDLPKFTVFGNLRRVGDSGGLASDLSFHRATPRTDLEAHSFMGWAARAWLGRAQWSHKVQVDRVGDAGTWEITEFQAHASTRLSSNLRLYTRYSRRQPFDYWNPDRELSYRRTGLGTGMTWSWGTGSTTAEISIRDATEGVRTTTYSGSLQLPRIAGSRWGFSTWASRWSDDAGSGASVSPGVTRPIGKGFGRLGYRYYHSNSSFYAIDSHTALASLTTPIRPGMRLSFQAQAGWGGNLRNFGLNTGIWKSF